ncbi:chemotaxis protein CheW [Pirellulaceae bacterium SH449]
MSDEFSFSTGMPFEEMAEYIQMFVDETSEQLDELVEVLLVLEKTPGNATQLNESFRLIHSIKGAAAMMGLDSIALLTHHLENHFDRLRSGVGALDKSMMSLILKCIDYLREAVELIRLGRPLVSAPELIEALSQSIGDNSFVEGPKVQTLPDDPSLSEEPHVNVSSAPAFDRSESKQKRIIVYLDRSIELPELKAELIIARLSDLAVINRTSPDIDQLKALTELRTLQIWLCTALDDETLRTATDIVGVDMVEIDDVPPPEFDPIESISDTAEQASIPDENSASEESRPLIESILVETQEEIKKASPDAGKHASPDMGSKVVETLRVDIQRLDRLMNLTGELVVNRARFTQIASQLTDTFKKTGLISHLRDLCELLKEPVANDSSSGTSDVTTEANLDQVVNDKLSQIRSTALAIEEHLQTLERGRRSFLQLNEAIDQFSRVSEGLQRGVLNTRMIPVGPLFNRFKRTVRDVSEEMGKSVNLIICGENTELDKRMIDELGDPLVHLVRNAIDHGIESESVRRSRGKPDTGTLTLDASHSGNHVLITISDDGGGINVDKVKRRAIERGFVSHVEADRMTEHEICQFIWAPGFSTAEVVSDISGRGVGMDIVKTRIGELNGTVEVESVFGQGTRFIIRLPLTLAIIRSLLFRLDQGTFAAPIENVREIVSISRKDVISVHGRDSIEVRGEFIPLVRINDVFDWHTTEDSRDADKLLKVPSEEKNRDVVSVLIMASATKSMGLEVCELRGCQDVVVKPLDENFTHIRGLGGASILGDGSVCLLLDVSACLELTRQRMQVRSLPNGMSRI